MAKIRIYKLKGYIDVDCDSVSICPTKSCSLNATIIGGSRDGEVILNVYGAKVLKEHLE